MNTITRHGLRILGAAATLCASLVGLPAHAAPLGQGAVQSLDDVEKATLYISARGRYWSYDDNAQMMGDWSGSGFLIDPSGVAVTNNHVVAGASSIEVFISGQGDSFNAKVLGRSECSDLAVIQLDGEGFTYLNWYTATPKVGLQVYAAGFPLSDPQFDLQDGIISKARAGGNTTWSSVKQVLQHSASLNPGNSGGPLVTDGGAVVGVNYRSRSAEKQYFAIARDEALPLIRTMRQGKDVDTVGIAPEADVITIGDEKLMGIRVTAVQSGSPADQAEFKPGDFIYEMEGAPLSEDGTMKEFCRIVRSRRATDAISVKVLRTSTGEVMEGQFNGRPLKVVRTLDTPQAEPTTTAGQGNTTLEITNESPVTIGGLNIAAPDATEWGDNVLSDVTIAAGESYMVRGITEGTFDLRALNEEGKSLGSIYNVALEGDLKWTVYGLASLPSGAQVKLEDDFSDASNWELTTDEFADFTIEEEQYRVNIKQPQRLAWGSYTGFKTRGNFLTEVGCSVDKEGSVCGLGFAVNDNNLLWFEVNPSQQTYSLQQLKNDEWQPNLIESATTAYISPVGSNSLALGRQGKKVSLYMNGTLIDSVDASLTGNGYVIFGGGASDNEQVLVTLDDLMIWQVK